MKTSTTNLECHLHWKRPPCRRKQIIWRTVLGNITKGREKGYSDAMKQFFIYIFLTGGRIAYEALATNLPLPSGSTISRTIRKSNWHVIEGECQVNELKSFLEAHNVTPPVWLSHNATGIINWIQYDRKTNKLVGFVLPLDTTGMSKTNTYLATSTKATDLCLFGTDNEFDY